MSIERSRRLYRRNAPVYDVMALPFRGIRRAALSLLAPQPGEIIVDVACGTGLSFTPLVRAVGAQGRIVGIDGSPDMLRRARHRIARHGWSNVSTVLADADSMALVQAWLRDLGRALGYDVWVAVNDRNRVWDGGRLADGCLETLPLSVEALPGADAIRLIDVLWLERAGGAVAAAFEVEHTTSIYSGIVRLLDLALGSDTNAVARTLM